MLCVFGFWISTVISELFLSHEAIVVVNRGIVYAMWILIPAMAAIGGSGFALCRNRSGQLLDHKKMRMPFIAANGLLILLPAAYYLYSKAVVVLVAAAAIKYLFFDKQKDR